MIRLLVVCSINLDLLCFYLFIYIFRRLRGDQLKVFKIVNGYEDVDRNMFFKLKKAVEPEDTKQH